MNTFQEEIENRYNTYIDLSSSSMKIQKGTKFLYFITAKDESGNTVISPTNSFTIS